MPNDNFLTLWRQHASVLNIIQAEWDKAEGDIKRAEQINDAICVPAIKELRYAGRRIVDAISEINSGDPNGHAAGYINDARLGCHRARHDAVDAATAKIVSEIEIASDIFGTEIVVQCYPEFHRLFELIEYAKSEIARSRGDRQQRMDIYHNLSETYFLEITQRYSSFRQSTLIMIDVTKARRRGILANYAIGIIGVLIGLVGVITGYLFWLFPR